jgi:hypothetical protein
LRQIGDLRPDQPPWGTVPHGVLAGRAQPEPLFTTEDDFVAATRKLIAYRALVDDDDDAEEDEADDVDDDIADAQPQAPQPPPAPRPPIILRRPVAKEE